MAAKRDYYEVLGVDRGASEKAIADAYRKLAIRHHPDKNPGDDEAVQLFKEAAEAFEVLSDPEKRARYDRHGHAGVGGSAPHFSDVGDIFQAFGDIFGDSLFGDLFGGGRGGRRRVHRGADLRADVTIDLMEAAQGVEKSISFRRHERCGDCSGSGAKPGTRPESCQYCGGHGQVIQQSGVFRVQTTCPACKGAGQVVRDPCPGCRGRGLVGRRVEREVAIPAGVDNGVKLRLTAEGEPSPDGGPAGDCYVVIHVAEHPLFERHGRDLICHVPLTYTQAALGAVIEIPTLEGRDEMEVHAGVQPGEVIRLAGRGMPDPRRRGRGDILVVVTIDVPKKLDRQEEELLRRLAEVEHANVSPHRRTFFDKLRDYFVPDAGATKTEEKS